MNVLCVQAANGTNSDSDRESINKEITAIKKEIDRVGNETKFNEIRVLQGGGEPVGYITEVRNKVVVDYITQTQKETITEYVMQEVEKEIEKITYLQVTGYSTENNPYVSVYFPGVVCGHQYNYNETDDYGIAEKLDDTFYLGYYFYDLDFSKVNTAEAWKNLDGAAFTYECGEGCHQLFSFYFDNSRVGIVDMTPDVPVGATYNGPTYSKTFIIGTKDYTNSEQFISVLKAFAADVGTIYPGYNGKDHTYIGHAMTIESINGTDLMVGSSYDYGGFTMGVPTLDIKTETVKEIVEMQVPIEKEIEVEVVIPIERVESYTVEVPVFAQKDIIIHYGTNTGELLLLQLPHIDCDALEMNDINVLTVSDAENAIEEISRVIGAVNVERGRIGAYTNRLEHLINNQNNVIENTQAAESRIRDTDMAEEMVNLSTYNILEQVGLSVMSQANQSAAMVLELLKG
jgi:flagellin